MFTAALGTIFVAAWLLVAIACVIGGGVMIIGGIFDLEDGRDWMMTFVGLLVAGGGICLLLLFGAFVTGEINFDSRPDGCYHVYAAGSGKTKHTEYDPIPCPWVTP